MKIVHLLTTDLGGTYKAVVRIHEGMLLNGVDSKILLRTKHHSDSIGEVALDTPIKAFISKAKNVGNMLYSAGDFQSEMFGTDISKHPTVKEADAILVHWCNSFISDKGIEKLTRLNKPVILVAHDMWYATGGCHTDGGCGNYTNGCDKCAIKAKKASLNVIRKKKCYRNVSMVIGPSKWIVNVMRDGLTFDNQKLRVISNPINKDIFFRIDEALRDNLFTKYGINKNKKVVLYGATSITNENKGGADIVLALNQLSADDYQLVVFGNQPEEQFTGIKLDTTYLGYIHGDEAMNEVYNLADVVVVPSRQESFGYTVAEALSAGIPVTAYGIGGILDQIEHLKNGYLAQLGHSEELTKGIIWCCSNEVTPVDIHNSIRETGNKYIEEIRELVNE